MAPSYRTVQDILRKSGKGRSTIHGDSYHLRLAIMIILRAYQMHQLDNELDFTIAVEVAASGKFDDILYHCTSPRLPTGTLFIQAKHKLKDGNVSKPNGGSKITEKALLAAWDTKSAYSIPMYFMSFLEVDQNLPSGSRYVLCTNAGLEKNIESHFTIINPEQDNALLFCEDIGATCYQLSRDKPFPRLADILRDTCIAKLGKLFAEAVFAGTVVTLNDILVDTLYSFIHTCLVRLKPKPNDSSVSTFGFKKEFFNESDSTTTGKFQTAIRKEYETLAKDKQKYDSNSLYKLEVKIEIKRSFTATPNKRQANIFAEFDQKVHEFYAKFLLVCNSSNEEALREKAMTLLPRWCNVERGTAFDKLQSVLLDALKSDKPVPMGLKFVQQCFVDIEFKQNIGRLMSFSEEYLSSLRLKHSQVEVHPQYLKRSSVHAFLQNKSAFGVYQFDSLLDMTLSSYILMQMLSLSNCDTLFVDSAKYQTGEYMATILQNLLSYLKAVNHPTIKVITVLGKHDQVSINAMKKLSKKYCQKIIVVEKVSGDTPPNGGPMEWYFGNNVKHEAWSQMFKVNDLLLFGTVSPLSGIVDEADNLSFLLALLAL
uniref:Uncharacterized protein n=1 Tax=Anopheles maculatus TaxID=74869 RepID=A0A182SI11_9DIPT